MKIEIIFPRTIDGQRHELCKVNAIPREGECITTSGDDLWTVQTVIYFTPVRGGIDAQIRVRI